MGWVLQCERRRKTWPSPPGDEGHRRRKDRGQRSGNIDRSGSKKRGRRPDTSDRRATTGEGQNEEQPRGGERQRQRQKKRGHLATLEAQNCRLGGSIGKRLRRCETGSQKNSDQTGAGETKAKRSWKTVAGKQRLKGSSESPGSRIQPGMEE